MRVGHWHQDLQQAERHIGKTKRLQERGERMCSYGDLPPNAIVCYGCLGIESR